VPFFGGLPIAVSFGFTYPALIGAVMAVAGVLFAWILLMMQNNVDRAKNGTEMETLVAASKLG
jgi:hypothetical protein